MAATRRPPLRARRALIALLGCAAVAAGCGGGDDGGDAAAGGPDLPGATAPRTTPSTTPSKPAARKRERQRERQAERRREERREGGAQRRGGSGPRSLLPRDLTPSERRRALVACRRGAATTPVSAELKRILLDICEKSAAGKDDEVRAASAELCRKIVAQTAPKGASRQHGFEGCEQTPR